MRGLIKGRAGRRLAIGATAALAAAGLAACGGSGGSGGSDSSSVTIWTSVDQPVLDGFKAHTDAAAKSQGITIKWEKVTDVNSLIMTKIQAGQAPDIALIPQPGVVANIVKLGAAKPLDDVVDTGSLNMLPGTLEAGTVDGKVYGIMINSNLKSLVFYPKKAWDAAGYQAPTSIAELEQLTDKIKSDGSAPWCFGIESDTATGWPATDWIEELVMKYGGAEKYNQWVTHEIPFDDPVVKQAGEEFQKLVLTDGNIPGNTADAASTNFGDADNEMWNAKPGCWMLKQGTFITAFFPDNVQKDLENQVGIFGFPPAEAGGDNPLLGGGDMAVMFNNDSATEKAMKIISATDMGNEAAANGSAFLSPHSDFDNSKYTNYIIQEAAKVLGTGSALLFDGSDQMPGQVGAGTFWKEMTSFITGDEDLDTALKAIDDSWPAS